MRPKAVALYARAWVEMGWICSGGLCPVRRPLREGVGRNSVMQALPEGLVKVALYARAWVEMRSKAKL